MKTLVICIDDVGFDILDTTPTPNFDKLRAEGVNPLFWCYPVCNPSRAAFLTGMYGYRNGMGSLLRASHDIELAPGMVTLPPGRNVFFGKWHLSSTAEENTHPIRCGFEYFDGHIRNVGDYKNWPRVTTGPDSVWTEEQETDYLTSYMTSEALDEMRSGTQNIFLSYAAIHKPLHVAPYGHDLESPWNDDKKARSMLRCLDRDVGALLATAKYEGYRVLVWSDNGTSGDVLDGLKGTLYEGGIRTLCTFWNWGGISQEDGAIVSVVDLMEMIDGVSRPNSIPYGSRRVLYSEKFAPNNVHHSQYSRWAYAVRDQRWKWIKNKDDTEELYDLFADPNETLNLVDDYPFILSVMRGFAESIQG
jgi:arylsulfatase A-like enzyme